MMDIVNQIGHVQFWGLCPAANLLKYYKQESEQKIKILISGCSDIRHILKTLCDIGINELHTGKKRFHNIEIYFHETNKQLLCRCMLLLHILHETNLSFDERMQIFLDLYGNSMIKERNARYLNILRDDLLNFIHDDKRTKTPLKQFIKLNLIKSLEIDELSQIMKAWSIKVPFDMQKLRDSKLRYLYRERYDYRSNLVDWDYNMLLNECAPIVHYYHYKEWRLTGLAFEQRFSTYVEPNRTLSSYAPGRKKQEKTACLVRGYWGDIVVSPYIAMGVRCDYPQADLLFKKANLKYIGHSVELTEYNLQYWLTMLEKGEEYKKVFRDYYRADEQTKKKLEEKDESKQKQKQLKQIKEEPEEEQIIQKKEEQSKEKQENKIKKKKEKELDSDEEEQKMKVDLINSKEINYQQEEKDILLGFKKYNVKIHLMGMNSEKLIISKFQQFFDVVTLGFVHTAFLAKDVHKLVKKGGLLLAEKATYLIPKKKEERNSINEKIQGLIQQDKQFKVVEEDTDLFIYQKTA